MVELENGILWLAGLCVAMTGIITFASKVRKPFDDLKQRIIQLEKTVGSNHDKLTHDNESFKRQEEVNELILKSCSLLMKHCADNNHTGELDRQAKELDAYIYKKGGSL